MTEQTTTEQATLQNKKSTDNQNTRWKAIYFLSYITEMNQKANYQIETQFYTQTQSKRKKSII